jgi:hypothetical protein
MARGTLLELLLLLSWLELVLTRKLLELLDELMELRLAMLLLLLLELLLCAEGNTIITWVLFNQGVFLEPSLAVQLRVQISPTLVKELLNVFTLYSILDASELKL